jgi:hypothetical protein
VATTLPIQHYLDRVEQGLQEVSYSLSHSFSHALSHTLTQSLSHTNTDSLSLCHTLSVTHSLSLSFSHTQAFSLFLPLCMCVCLSDYLPSISLSLISEVYLSTDPSFLLLIVYTSLLAQYNCTLPIILLYPHSLSSSASLISSPLFRSSPSVLASPLCSSPLLSFAPLFSSLFLQQIRYSLSAELPVLLQLVSSSAY